jgi:hypothetical protein
MRFFWFAFTFYLLALSAYQCDDTKEVVNAKTEFSQSTDKHGHAPEQCSPFCTCSHCPASAFYPSVAFFTFQNKTIAIDRKEPLNFYTFIYYKSIASSIWQPPKIS